MDKLFGLSLFCNALAVGILIGLSRWKLGPRLLGGLLAYFAVFYTGMTLVVLANPTMFIPH